jgi:N-acetylmuramoyl-L-alanine amidase
MTRGGDEREFGYGERRGEAEACRRRLPALPALAALLLVAAAVAPPAEAGPDRELYRSAVSANGQLLRSTSLSAQRDEWEKVVLLYRRVVARHPRSPYCDNALLAVGDLYREMARRFRSPRLNDDAVKAYRTLVSEYPTSSLGDDALHKVFEIYDAVGTDAGRKDAAQAYLRHYPRGRHASAVRAALRDTRSAPTASAPADQPASGLTQILNLRSWSGDDATRVVLDLERQVELRYDRIGDPDRLWIDLLGTRLHPNLGNSVFPVGDGLLEKVRVGPNRDGVIRVVLDFKSVGDYTLFYLESPTRLVIDVRGAKARVDVRTASRVPPDGTPVGNTSGAVSPGAASPPASAPATPPATDAGPTATAPAPAPSPAASADVRRAEAGAEAPPGPLEAPSPPEVNRAGSYSLARQLGLGARRIVIDPGHGGHDPGSIGPGGLQEKDLVLDVARRLAERVERELGAEVVLTRSTDVFIPLEERTAIANSRGADLFLSIHANSSRSRKARGIETYFLNFAADPHAEEVAARENSISQATLKDLQNLVKAITLNSKIDESRDFASSVHEALMSGFREPGLDRGVRTAPFYVLIGANMPSVLAEIAFISHPQDERLLKQSKQRQKIADGLLLGVRRYLEALNRTQTRQLTRAADTPTVAQRSAGRR